MNNGSSMWLDGWEPEPRRERTLQVLDVARRYYEDGMSQAEIAAAIRYSRPTVGRILEEARQTGIVQIRVTNPLERALELERVISSKFGIANVRVIPNTSTTDGIAEVGDSTAQILSRILRPGDSIALSAGRIHHFIAENIKPETLKDLTFVQLVGTLSQDSPIMSGADLCRRFAEVFGGNAVTIEAPLLARTPHEGRNIRSHPAVAKALRLGADADIAVVGVGVGFHHPTGVLTSLLPTAEIRALRKQGAVGHILAQFFDENGDLINTPVNDLVVGLPLQELRNVRHVVGVAAGSQKAPALKAAIRGQLINALILDRSAAQSLAYSDSR